MSLRSVGLILGTLGWFGAAAIGHPLPGGDSPAKADVVFVCEHGSVKSLIAAQWFNRLAAERKLSVRAVSRGVTPDAQVPDAIEAALLKDGMPVGGVTPTAFSAGELKAARRVITIGLAVDAVVGKVGVAYESWPDIPPATQDYAAARDRMRERIENLLNGLQARGQ